MRLKRTKIDLEDGSVKHTTRVEGEFCLPGTHDAKVMAYTMLADLSVQHDFTRCGDKPFDSLTMFHDGTKWIVEATGYQKANQ